MFMAEAITLQFSLCITSHIIMALRTPGEAIKSKRSSEKSIYFEKEKKTKNESGGEIVTSCISSNT